MDTACHGEGVPVARPGSAVRCRPPVDLGPGKQRTVLAALLLNTGQVITTETLIDRVWGDRPPASPRSALYSYLTRLRRVLAVGRERDPAGQPGSVRRTRLVHCRGGYLLDVDPEEVDLHRFRSLWDRARSDGCADALRVKLLGEALGLWRGRPMSDLDGSWVATVRETIVQQHLDVVLLWAEAQLRLGRSGAAVGLLREVAAQHPLVEPLAAKLIEALHAEGRTAEALDLYTVTRRRLIDELGIEPAEQLRRLQSQILRTGLDASGPAETEPPAQVQASSPRPAQLPAGVHGFAGRTAELGELDRVLDELDGPAVTIIALWGTAGAGKTALAVHWAQHVAHRLPDGQLYVNLRGFQAEGAPATAEEALRELLDGLGVAPTRLPVGLPARAALYRSLLAGRRTLIVLDNAVSAEQVRPLLPGAGALVLVTSRNQLTDLVVTEGARVMMVDLMGPDEALELLAKRLGEARVGDEPEAVAQIISGCAGLPLSLAIVAARAAINPEFSLTAIAGELRSNNLDPFTGADGVDLRSTLSWSYRNLRPRAARLFRLLALHPGPDLDAPAAASLLGEPARQARAALTELTGVSLVHEHQPGRYAFHDLLRAYAAELLDREETAHERAGAIQRMLDHYLRVAHGAAFQLDPHRTPPGTAVHFDDRMPVQIAVDGYESAVAWLTTERRVLVASVDLALRQHLDTHAWHLAWTLTDFLDMRGHLADLSATQLAAMSAAQRLGDKSAQAFSYRILGRLQAKLGHYPQARAHLAEAVGLYAAIGDSYGESLSNLDVSWVYGQEGLPAIALKEALRALDLARACGHRAGIARALNAVGWCAAEAGEHRQALSSCTEAIGLLTEIGDRHGIAATQDSLGYAYHRLGRYAAAAKAYADALAGYRDLGDRFNEGLTLTNLADNHAATGEPAAARNGYRAALAIFEELGHPQADLVRKKLAAAVVPAAGSRRRKPGRGLS